MNMAQAAVYTVKNTLGVNNDMIGIIKFYYFS